MFLANPREYVETDCKPLQSVIFKFYTTAQLHWNQGLKSILLKKLINKNKSAMEGGMLLKHPYFGLLNAVLK